MKPNTSVRTALVCTTVPRWTVIAMAAALASGCSVLQEDKIDYKSNSKPVSTLEIPPDLTQLNKESRYNVPGGAVTASSMAVTQSVQRNTTATDNVGDVRVERSGNQRWLVVNRPPEKVWGQVRDFWQENGFLFTQDQENLGLLETDWAENRAKLPQDIIRSTLGKVFDSLYETGERDKFRTRLERRPDGGTDIYITHRGMVEVYTSDKKEQTAWQPRPADPELENEFMRRMMVKLGTTQEQAKAQIAGGATPSSAKLSSVNNQPVLQVNEGFDRAWRRVGLALDRTGFTVEDRDRSQGVYFVRYVSQEAAKTQEPGFFDRLTGMFSSSTPKETAPGRYRLVVKGSDAGSTVSVQNANGQPESSPQAQRMLQVIADDLK